MRLGREYALTYALRSATLSDRFLSRQIVPEVREVDLFAAFHENFRRAEANLFKAALYETLKEKLDCALF
jgi:hypothetical protein